MGVVVRAGGIVTVLGGVPTAFVPCVTATSACCGRDWLSRWSEAGCGWSRWRGR